MKWEFSKIGDNCEVTSSKRIFYSEYVKSGIPFYRSKEVIQSFLGQSIDEHLYISEEKYKQIADKFGVPEAGDMLLTSVGTIGVPYLIKESDCFYFKDGNLTWFKNFSKNLSSKYLYYWIQSPQGKGVLFNSTIGSSQKALTISMLKGISIPLPPIGIQNRITDILSSYDDLIENNQKQIKLLEEAAMRLYKEWFVNLRFPGHENTKIVDGVPEGWEYKEVGSLISKTPRTKQVKKSEYNNSGEIPIIDQSREFIAGYTDDRETIVDLGVPVIVFGDHTRILKLINFPFAKGADGTQLIVSGIEEMPQHLLYCSLVNIDLSNYHYARHFKYLKASKIIVPTKNISEEFESIVEIYFKVIQILRDKIFLLQKSRDFLLPKLMNGEIEV